MTEDVERCVFLLKALFYFPVADWPFVQLIPALKMDSHFTALNLSGKCWSSLTAPILLLCLSGNQLRNTAAKALAELIRTHGNIQAPN